MRLNVAFMVSVRDGSRANLTVFVTDIELFFLEFYVKSETIWELSCNLASFSWPSSIEFNVIWVRVFFLDDELTAIGEFSVASLLYYLPLDLDFVGVRDSLMSVNRVGGAVALFLLFELMRLSLLYLEYCCIPRVFRLFPLT